MLELAFSDGEESDLVGMEFAHAALDTPILIPFSRQDALNPEKILVTIQKVMQSKRALTFDENLVVKVTCVKPPQGKGRRKRNTVKFDVWYLDRWSIIQIRNKDDLCCARALIVAKARLEKDPRWEAIPKADQNRYTLQKRLMQELMEEAGLKDHTGGCGIPELKKFEVVLFGYQIKVFDREKTNKLLFQRPQAQKIFHLYLNNRHYDVNRKMPAFVNKSYYCDVCNMGYSNKEVHRCETHCMVCKGNSQCKKEEWIQCPDYQDGSSTKGIIFNKIHKNMTIIFDDILNLHNFLIFYKYFYCECLLWK